MFKNECLEGSNNVVEVRVVGAESLSDFVEFMYRGEIKGKEKKRLREVMAVADMYMIDLLKMMCSELLEGDGEGRKVQSSRLFQMLHSCLFEAVIKNNCERSNPNRLNV